MVAVMLRVEETEACGGCVGPGLDSPLSGSSWGEDSGSLAPRGRGLTQSLGLVGAHKQGTQEPATPLFPPLQVSQTTQPRDPGMAGQQGMVAVCKLPVLGLSRVRGQR